MSQLGSSLRVIIRHGVKHQLSFEETFSFADALYCSLEWDMTEEELEEDMRSQAEYMLTQSNGLYGVSHTDIRLWLVKKYSGPCLTRLDK